ncbi:hypothetical protein [Limnoglobus roseus]|uniref:hypothetical protein n=1 Tax=Limnoglobus roseus TaxID=2598579 RepID=UPI00143DCCA4|nr:hypothetical protein [Limnoglobus roseus]
MDALPHGEFRQTDEDDLAESGREIDFDLDRQGVDADERERVQLGEHDGGRVRGAVVELLYTPGVGAGYGFGLPSCFS